MKETNAHPMIAILSDTHGALTLEKLTSLFPERCRAVTLGDIAKEELNLIRRYFDFLGGVKGNCDTGNSLPQNLTLMIDGVRFFLSHEPPRVNLSSRRMNPDEGYDVVLFGHLHRRIHAMENGLVYFSPGAYSGPRDKFGPSVGVMELSGGSCEFRYVEVT